MPGSKFSNLVSQMPEGMLPAKTPPWQLGILGGHINIILILDDLST